jgi:hypothetical protein
LLSFAQLCSAWPLGLWPFGYCFDLGSILTISLKNRLSVQILFDVFLYRLAYK